MTPEDQQLARYLAAKTIMTGMFCYPPAETTNRAQIMEAVAVELANVVVAALQHTHPRFRNEFFPRMAVEIEKYEFADILDRNGLLE